MLNIVLPFAIGYPITRKKIEGRLGRIRANM